VSRVDETIQITMAGDGDGARRLDLAAGTPVSALLPPAAAAFDPPIIGAMVNNDCASLSYPLTVAGTVRFITMADPHGWRIYRHSLSFLLAKAVQDTFPSATFCVEHSFGPGLFCTLCLEGDERRGIAEADVARLEEHMRALVARDIPIRRLKVAYMDAVRRFEAAGLTDKLNLLRHRNPPHVVLHDCDGFTDTAHGPLAPATGHLKRFRLIPHHGGLILQMPTREAPMEVPPFEDQPQLFHIFREHKEWGRILGVSTVGRLNQIVADGGIEDFVRTAEALHEKKLAQIADTIASAADRIRVVLIAGPSSAGKTTFAKRLTTHLTVNGLRPVILGTDDYFVGQEHNPLDDRGQPDYEHIEAVDIELLNDHLTALIAGREVVPSRYDFVRKERVSSKTALRIDGEQLILIEGIHGLNPRLTHRVPAERKFRIFVSALTQLSVDGNNRISTTDNRLMRRIVRDNRFRGYPALETLRQWSSVRRGEKRWIFPFQREADATFNSALDYELAVLKPYVEPLLMQIKPCHAEYAESRRLTEFLLNFLGVSSRTVPGTSILREYIGGSFLRY
jgi:uridine kinase